MKGFAVSNIKLEYDIPGFIQECENMDWDNMSNVTICLENALQILKGIVKQDELD